MSHNKTKHLGSLWEEDALQGLVGSGGGVCEGEFGKASWRRWEPSPTESG